GPGRGLYEGNSPGTMRRMTPPRECVLPSGDGAGHYPGSGPATPTRTAAMLALCCALALLAGCGRGDVRPMPRAPAPAPAPAQVREWPVVAPQDPAAANAVLMRAISLVGTPYRYGGNTPEGG